jgi:arginyl-tRNA synthetase
MIKRDLEKWLQENKIEGKIEHPSISKFGDYAIRTGRPVENLSENSIVEKTEFMAGFTNIWLKKDVLVKESETIGSEEWSKNLAENGQNKTMVIDYSAPNIAKPFGIGHLRSTDIGQAIYNLYKILGWKCIGDNHLGDWGTQFGKLIVAIKKWGLTEKNLENYTIEDLETLYIKFHKEAETDDNLNDEARDWFSKLENKDTEATEIWQKCIEISMTEFNRVYELLGVKIDLTLGESFYQDKMESVVKLMEEKKILVESEGAKIVEFPDMPPAMITKSNGTTTYFTRDMATIKYRMETWNPDLIIYEVGADQDLHFRQVFATSEKLGFNPTFYHVAHGLIRWKDGKFSTRHGDTIHLSEVIEKAMEEAKKIAPNNDNQKIRAVAIGAIKFNDLAQDPKKDIIFDWEKVMSMEGNSGPYLQYTYARCKSILVKTEKQLMDFKLENIEWNEEEMALLREFYKFEEKIIEGAQRFSPAVVAEYLLGLARKYNEFYAKNRVIGENTEEQRLFLTDRTAKILKLGLDILGIKTIEKM